MSQLFFLLLLISSALTSFARNYYVYTARVNGSWNDNGVNGFPLGDVEINIHGTLAMTSGTNIPLTAASSIELIGTGKITGTNNTQIISIGGVTKDPS